MVEFKTVAYQGPLDLLLALIQKAEVNIYDIPISEITDQFLDYLHHAKEIGLGDLSEFYKMAAELIWIKSQMMLPVDIEYDEEYADPREELVERLLEYSKFKKYSELLMGTEDTDNLVLSRKASEFQLPFSDDELWEDVTARDLMDTFMDMMKKEEKVFNVYESVTEKEKIALMNELFETHDSIKFSDLFVKRSAEHIICAFLAVLESVKDKMILVDQPELFGEMTITKRPADWNPNLADDYDAEYDEISRNHLEDEDDYSVVSEDSTE
ncbi:MAG: segregation/condensation protein A [Spirochaetales bacterium]|nr:segregation/condensation protein A [Spirochaetales bacterium]